MTEVVGGGVGGGLSMPGVGRPGGCRRRRWWGGSSLLLVVVAIIAGRGHVIDVDGAGSGCIVNAGGGVVVGAVVNADGGLVVALSMQVLWWWWWW